jgi:hypothetical protein
MVARLDGPTPELAMGLVDKAMQGKRKDSGDAPYFDLLG